MSEQDAESTPQLKGDARNADQAILLLAVLALTVTGVVTVFVLTLPSWKPVNNMEQQPYYKPYVPSTVFADGMSQRPLVSGVVPRPVVDSPGIPYVAVRVPGPANYPDVATSDTIPVPITRELLERGQQQFEIYCSMCHGTAGEGNGMVVQRGFYPPPSYFIPRLLQEHDAHFYNVISNGYGAMFSYSDRVAPGDRWAIVAYIRALQLAVSQTPPLNQTLQKQAGVRQ